MSNGLSQKMIIFLMGLMILTGSINTIANKLQNSSMAFDQPYQHAWFITFCMFLGEVLCIFPYLIHRKKWEIAETVTEGTPQEKDRPSKKEASPFHLALPALCDFFGSTIMTFGLTMMAGSVYQMFRGSLIFFTAAFSVIFLKSKLYRHNYLALLIIISGLVLVGLANQIFPSPRPEGCSSGSSVKESFWGIILVIVSQLFAATQFIIEEKFMKHYNCHPLKAVGWEGIWGSLLYLILLVSFEFIPCNPGSYITSLICSPDDKGKWYLENTIFAFRQMGDNRLLLFYVILYICSIAVFNFVGISVSKYSSSAARSVVDTLRTIVVWAFFLMPFIKKCERESFSWLQLLGFFLLVLGTVIYNELLVIPFCGFNLYTKKGIDKREEEGGKESQVQLVSQKTSSESLPKEKGENIENEENIEKEENIENKENEV